jgi:hypothetical protein
MNTARHSPHFNAEYQFRDTSGRLPQHPVRPPNGRLSRIGEPVPAQRFGVRMKKKKLAGAILYRSFDWIAAYTQPSSE